MAFLVAAITGSNKGIGLEIVRSLCRHLGQNGVVYLTARAEGRGLAAVALLQEEGFSPKFHQLDITNRTSIEKFRDHVKRTHGGIDILVNNAGIGTPIEKDITPYERALRPIRSNFFGFLDVCHVFLPLIRSGGRVVNVASTTANMAYRKLSEEVKTKFRQASTEEDVIRLVNEFLEATKAGDNKGKWNTAWGYGVSKLGVVLLTKIYARDIAQDKTRTDILINACCPGFVRTDMSAPYPDDNFGGMKISIPEGADTPMYLALLPPDTKQPQGQFLLRRKVYDFINTDMNIQI